MSPRRWMLLTKQLARMRSPNADLRVYPEMRFKHQCYSINFRAEGE